MQAHIIIRDGIETSEVCMVHSLIEYFYSNTSVNEIAVNRLIARDDVVTHEAKLVNDIYNYTYNNRI